MMHLSTCLLMHLFTCLPMQLFTFLSEIICHSIVYALMKNEEEKRNKSTQHYKKQQHAVYCDDWRSRVCRNAK